MHKEPPIESGIIQLPLEDVMHNSMLPYAEHVILERALPRVEDGLKPVQRRILYTMSELGLVPDKPHRKCARIVGDCLGKYHPHGDSSVYDALVRMAQDFSLREKLVDGHGNFGSIDGDGAAAMRYTEARMTPLALEMLRDIDKDTVPFRLNFDDTLREPDMLPARYPNLLVNGASGIAVGLATNIPPHNLRETIGAAIALIDNPDITVSELMNILPAPDFPTGGVLLDTPELRTAYETGRAKLTLRARVHFEKGNLGRSLIVIDEVPYMISKAAMLERILKLSEEKKALLGGIYDIRDESDRTGLRAVIELKRDVDPQAVLACLYKYSDMQVTFGVNMVAIAEGRPMQLGLRPLLHYYIEHQKTVVTRRTQYELEHALARAHILEGLIKAVDCLDEIIAAIRASKNAKEAKARLMADFGFSDVQAQAILDLRLQRLTGLEILALRREYEELLKTIARLQGILASEKKLMTVIKKELQQIADQYGDDRRTRVESVQAMHLPEVDETPLAEEAAVIFTRSGQLRRLQPRALEKLAPPEAESDMLVCQFRAMTDHTLYLFTNQGNCFTVSVGSLNDASRPRDRGTLLTGILAGLKEGEHAVSVFCVEPGGMQRMPDLMFCTRGGMIKRTAAAEYDIHRARFAAVTLKGSDSLLRVMPVQKDADIILCTKRGMTIRFAENGVNAIGRAGAGVKGIQLELGDEVILADQADRQRSLILCSDRGYIKRMPTVEMEVQGRGGKGIRCFTFNKNGSNGQLLAGALLVPPGVRFYTLQAHGTLTALEADNVPAQSRIERGSPLVMALMDDTVTEVFTTE